MQLCNKYACSIAVVLLAVATWRLLAPPGRAEWDAVPANASWGKRSSTAGQDVSVQPFVVQVPDEVLQDLDARLAAARLPTSFVAPAAPWERGIDPGYLASMLQYWQHEYDWRAEEAKLNEWHHYTTSIRGLRLHFVHERSDVAGALPLLLLHGWPGSIVEFQSIMPLLTTASAESPVAFNVVAPSMPGYAFSEPAAKPGMSSAVVARMYVELMARLGYRRYYVQGGDWGGVVAQHVAQLDEEHCLGMHVNFLPALPSARHMALQAWATVTNGFTPEPQYLSLGQQLQFVWRSSGYLHEHATKPDTIGTAVGSSPTALAAWILEKFNEWSYKGAEGFDKDALLTNLMMYWATNGAAPAIRLYQETIHNLEFWGSMTSSINVPVGYADFPKEMTRTPRSFLEAVCSDVVQYSVMPTGGHFAAMEEPELLAADLKSFVEQVQQRGKTGQ